jgi:hypothetical protein
MSQRLKKPPSSLWQRPNRLDKKSFVGTGKLRSERSVRESRASVLVAKLAKQNRSKV